MVGRSSAAEVGNGPMWCHASRKGRSHRSADRMRIIGNQRKRGKPAWQVALGRWLAGIVTLLVGFGGDALGSEPVKARWIAHHEMVGLRSNVSATLDLVWTAVDGRPVAVQELHSSSEQVEILQWSNPVNSGAPGTLQLRVLPVVEGRWDVALLGEVPREGEPRVVLTLTGVIDGSPRTTGAVKERTESALWITPGELSTNEALRNPRTIVDVRPAAEFQACAIPGSLNFAPHLLRTRSFLRDKQVVLTARGHHDDALVRLRSELLGKGFKSVRILRGGVNRWVLEGRPVSGSGDTRSALRISARELLSLRPLEGWHWVGDALDSPIAAFLGLGEPLASAAYGGRTGPDFGAILEIGIPGTEVPSPASGQTAGTRFRLRDTPEEVLNEFLRQVVGQQRRSVRSESTDISEFIRSFRNSTKHGSCCGGR